MGIYGQALADVTAWVNCIVYGLASITQFIVLWRCARQGWWYVKLGFAILNLYWCSIYLFVALTEPGQYMDAVLFGQIFIRIPFMAMGFLVLVAGIYSLKSKCRGNNE